MQKSYVEGKCEESTEKNGDPTIRSALISLPSVVLIVAQGSSGWTREGGKTKEGDPGEAGGGVGHGLSDRSGVEIVGDRSGVRALPTVGVPHA